MGRLEVGRLVNKIFNLADKVEHSPFKLSNTFLGTVTEAGFYIEAIDLTKVAFDSQRKGRERILAGVGAAVSITAAVLFSTNSAFSKNGYSSRNQPQNKIK